MQTILMSRFLKPIRSKQSGQVVVEYLLILAVVLGIFMLVARPGIGRLGKKIQEDLNKGLFAADATGAGFYYFPVK